MTVSERRQSPGPSSGRAIGPVGTFARLLLGSVFVGATVVAGTQGGLQWGEVALGLVAAPVVLLAWQVVRLRWTTERLDATGSIGFAVNFLIGAPFFMAEPTRDAALIFYGGSLLLAGIRGYAGCEVLAISNWILRRQDQVGCVVFSPLDQIETRVTTAIASSTGARDRVSTTHER